MMLGKRSGRPAPARHHHMRRTTSMTEFAPPDALAGVAEEEELELELEDEEAELQLLPLPLHAEGDHQQGAVEDPYGWAIGGAAAAGRADWLAAYRARAAAGGLRRNSADLTAAESAAAFLRACGLCHRRLGPGRDTFMYRGDTAFCSLECRQQHITIEEWKDKCALAAAAPPDPVVVPPAAGAAGSDKPGSIAAA